MTKLNMKNQPLSTSAEFLSGMRKDDKLIPVITIVVYLGNQGWDGSKSLHEMLDLQNIPESVRALLPDYKLILIDPVQADDGRLDQLASTLGCVLGTIKHSGNGKEMEAYIQSHRDRMSEFPVYAANLLGELCNIEYEIKESEEKVNMCQGVIDIRNEGIELGIEQGIEQGIEIGKLEEIISSVREGDYSIERGAEKAGKTVEELRKLIEEAVNNHI